MHALFIYLAFNDQILKVPHACFQPSMFLDGLKYLNWHKWKYHRLLWSLIFLEAFDCDSGVQWEQPPCLTYDDPFLRDTVDLPSLLDHFSDPKLPLLKEHFAADAALSFHSCTRPLHFKSQEGPHLSELSFRVEEGQKEIMTVVFFRKNVDGKIDWNNIIRLHQLPQLVLVHQFVLMLMLLIIKVFTVQQFYQGLEQEDFAHHSQVVKFIKFRIGLLVSLRRRQLL